jgi:hypothetical protein
MRPSVPFLDDLTSGGRHAHFGFDLAGLGRRATDMDWRFGSGTPLSGAAEDLALHICVRKLPAGRIEGELSPRGADK